MTDKKKRRKKITEDISLSTNTKTKKSMTENQTQVTTAALKKKDLQLPFLSDKLFSGNLLVFYLISLIASLNYILI